MEAHYRLRHLGYFFAALANGTSMPKRYIEGGNRIVATFRICCDSFVRVMIADDELFTARRVMLIEVDGGRRTAQRCLYVERSTFCDRKELFENNLSEIL